jgi:hypothetical protein
MNVGPITIERRSEGKIRLSAPVDNRELWFEIPEVGELPATLGDSFMIMGLAVAMLRNEPLVVSEQNPVSPMLLEHLLEVQRILSCWNPKFQRIPIHAATTSPSPSTGKVGSMYSGGVDSMQTLLHHQTEVSEAIFIGGFDFDIDSEQMRYAIERGQRVLAILQKPLVMVYSNQFAWGRDSGVGRNFWYSSYLAAASLFFRFERVLIPSSYTYAELGPRGSHLILDHLWSNGTTRFQHVDAEFRRSQKIAQIASDPRFVDELHVCWRNPLTNCGSCGKCVRTMIVLELLGLEGPFPRRVTAKDVAGLKAKHPEELSYLIDGALLAKAQNRPDMLRAVKTAIRRYDREKALEHIDFGVLGGLLHKVRRRFMPYHALEAHTNGRPDTEL